MGLADLEWHFEQFRYRRWRGDYYVDDDGLVQVVKPELDRKQTSHINKQQEALANTENPDSYWYGKTELVQGRL